MKMPFQTASFLW